MTNTEVYVLEGEHGDYEQRIQQVYGVFASLELALQGAADIPRLSKETYARYCAFKDELSVRAEAEGKESWEIESGPKPDFFCVPDRWWVRKMAIGQVGSGEEVFDSGYDKPATSDVASEASGRQSGIYGLSEAT